MPEGDSRLGRTSFTTSEVGLMVTFLVFGLVVSIVGTVLTYKHYFDIAKLFAGAGHNAALRCDFWRRGEAVD